MYRQKIVFIFISISLLITKAEEIVNCLEYVDGYCSDCFFDTYKSSVGISERFPISECIKKNNGEYNKKIYVSNQNCIEGSPCDGSEESPYDNLIFAFDQEGNQANQYRTSSLTFKILGKEHFILRKHLKMGYEQFFRRVNVSIVMEPHYCIESQIPGCLEEDEKVRIYIKVGIFNIYFAYKAVLANIIFDGNDLHIHNYPEDNDESECYNQEEICCPRNSIFKHFSRRDPCTLIGRPMVSTLGYLDWSFLGGLLTLEAIIEDPNAQTPELTILNCTFENFYPSYDQIWLGLIVMNDRYAAKVFINNSVINNNLISLIFVHQKAQFIDKGYSENFLNKERVILISYCLITKFNEVAAIFIFRTSIEFAVITLSFYSGSLYFNENDVTEMKNSPALINIFLLTDMQILVIENCRFSNIENFSFINSLNSRVILRDIIFENFFRDPIMVFSEKEVLITGSKFIGFNYEASSYEYLLFITLTRNSFFFKDNIILNSPSFALIMNSGPAIFQNNTVGNCNYKSKIIFLVSTNCQLLIDGLTFSNPGLVNENSFYVSNTQTSPIKVEIRNMILENAKYIDQEERTKEFFSWVQSNTGDSLIMENSTISKSEIGTFLKIPDVNSILLNNILVRDIILDTESNFQLVNGLLFKSISIKNLSFFNFSSNTTVLELFCQECVVDLMDTTFNKIYFNSATDLVSIKGSSLVNIRNISYIFFELNTVNEATLLSMQNIKSLVIDNLLLIDSFKLGGRLFAVLYASSCEEAKIINSAILFPEPSLLFPASGAAIISAFSKSTILENISFQNLRQVSQKLFYTQLGLINFFGSSVNIYEKNDFTVSAKNILVKSCFSARYGVISFLSIDNIELTNVTVENSNAVNGGGIYISFSSYVKLDQIFINNTKSQKGGAIYLQNIKNAQILHFKSFNTSSLSQGGSMYFYFVEEIVVEEAGIYNSSSFNDGGGLYVERASINIKNCEFKSLFTAQDGGFLRIRKSQLVIENLNGDNTEANSGSVLYVFDCHDLQIKHIIVTNITSVLRGAALYFSSVINFNASNLEFKDVVGKRSLGTIYIENSNSNSVHFYENITVENIYTLSASFLFYKSDQNVCFKNIIVRRSKCNLITMSSQENAEIIFENIEFYDSLDMLSDYAIQTSGLNIKFKGSNIISKVIPLNSIFYFEQSEVSLTSFQFLNYSKINKIFRFANILGSNFTLSGVRFKCFNCVGFQYFTQSEGTIMLENANLQGCETEEYSCIYLKDLIYAKVNALSIGNSKANIAGGLLVENCKISISKSNFFNNRNGNTELPISDVKFSKASLVEIHTSCFYISNSFTSLHITDCLQLVIDSSIFTSNETIGLTQGVLIDSTDTLISSSSFNKLRSLYGAAVRFSSKSGEQNSSSLRIQKSMFEKNKASSGGAVFIKGNAQVFMNDNTFEGNEAVNGTEIGSGIGGAVYFATDYAYDKIAALYLNKNIFNSNLAEWFAPTVFSLAKINAENGSNTFTNNYDSINFTSGLSGFPLKLVTANSLTPNCNKTEDFEFDSNVYQGYIISGVPFCFSVQLYDDFNQVLTFDSISKIGLVSSALISRGEIGSSVRGFFNFSDSLIYNTPNQDFLLNLSVNLRTDEYLPISESGINLQWSYTIYSRPCKKGEIYNREESSCLECVNTKYSLIDPMAEQNKEYMKCIDCPENAICYSGVYITPKAGFWRASNESSLILPCVSTESCLGISGNMTESERIHGKCQDHHDGPLCYFCERGHGRMFYKGLCLPCDSMSDIAIAKLFVGIFILLIYIGIQTRFAFVSQTKSYTGTFFKVLVNHIQQLSMISWVSLNWSPDIELFFSLQQYVSFNSDEFISIECFSDDLRTNLLVKKIIFSNILPFFLLFLSFGIWFINWFVRIKYFNQKMPGNYLQSRFIVIALIITYTLLPEILRKNFSLLDCIRQTNLDDSEIVYLSPDVICWEGQHIRLILMSTIPGLVFWGIFLPLLTGLTLRRFESIKRQILRVKKQEQGNAISKALSEIKTDKHLMIEQKKLETTMRISTEEPNMRTDRGLLIDEVKSYESGDFHDIFEDKGVIDLKNYEDLIEGSKIEEIPKSKIKHVFRENYLTVKPIGDKDEQPKEELESLSNEISDSIKIKRNPVNTQASEKGEFENTVSIVTDINVEESLYGLTKNSLVPAECFKFLIKGYKSRYYFWELVLYSKKFFLILIGTITHLFPSTNKPTILLVLLSFYLTLQIRFQPYANNDLNRLEILSLLAVFVTSNIGIILLADDLAYLNGFFLFIIIFMNAGFLVYWMRCVIKNLSDRGRLDFLGFSKKLSNLKKISISETNQGANIFKKE